MEHDKLEFALAALKVAEKAADEEEDVVAEADDAAASEDDYFGDYVTADEALSETSSVGLPEDDAGRVIKDVSLDEASAFVKDGVVVGDEFGLFFEEDCVPSGAAASEGEDFMMSGGLGVSEEPSVVGGGNGVTVADLREADFSKAFLLELQREAERDMIRDDDFEETET
jgi:hypothetical protein